ncbi:hypothetical protein DMN91_005550 [Ooceraea biroi]|uniref:Odorant receptor n=1 Tax=Ooceraea biroi TaxID=2015173 RepID=A0A026VSW4_OOCBI|nr:uncharacterized protein LOC105287075 isoform X4 [Ooceraea biroi]EZA46822.1 hypothetical protein X777_01187 [Ooceraea biroi]RLU21177.1 hypothetical protein DMN91_005550 [Ooceraea biroi]
MTVYIVLQYFNLNRILLLIVGLWPYQRTKLVKFQLCLVFGIFVSFIPAQLTPLLTLECTVDLVIKILPPILIVIMFAIKYMSFIINARFVKQMMEQLQHICTNLTDENEIAIMKNYGNKTRTYTASLILYAFCNLIIFILLPFLPKIAGIILFINESQLHHTVYIMTEYFVDREKYFYLILLHMDAAVCIGAIAVIGIATMFVGYMKHACAMFKICSYRIKHAIMLDAESVQLRDYMIHKKIKYAVDIHRKGIEFSTFVISSFEWLFFLLIAIGVLCLSLNLFCLLQTVSSGHNVEEFIVHFSCVSIILIYMFLGNYAAQEIIDHYNHIFITAYNIQWYAASIRIQKMILFLLQRGAKAFNLNLGGLFIGSLESAGMLISTSISYFTVLYSTRQN